MSALNPTRELCDAQNRPYFLWDCDMTLPEFVEKLKDPDIKKIKEEIKFINSHFADLSRCEMAELMYEYKNYYCY